MIGLLSLVLRKVALFALALVLVLAGLIYGPALWKKGETARLEAATRIERSALAQRSAINLAREQPDYAAFIDLQIARADATTASLRTSSEARLAAESKRLATLKREAEARMLDKRRSTAALFAGRSDLIIASLRAQQVDIPLLDRALQVVELRRGELAGMTARMQWRNHRQRVEGWRRDAIPHLREVQRFAAQDQVWRQQRASLRCTMVSVQCDEAGYRQHLLEGEKLRRAAQKLNGKKAALETERKGLAVIRRMQTQLRDAAAIRREAVAAYQRSVREAAETARNDRVNEAKSGARDKWPLAVMIVLGATLLPLLLKLLAFVVIAPRAARARPIRLGLAGAPMLTSASGASVTVQIDCDTELLLRGGWQSLGSQIKGKDLYLLSWRMPLACVAAGLVRLQRFRSDRREHITVTSPGDDQFEVALLVVPVGGAVTLQPRALVGVLKRRADRLRVRRPWRLGSRAAWLTMRLRHTVFHGPCSLIVQGRRGVVIEHAAGDRTIPRRLTLGFEHGVAVAARRTPSFLPYHTGEASLFEDRFSGDGLFLYEQRPSVSGRGLLWGRGLKGLGDAVLKAFGI